MSYIYQPHGTRPCAIPKRSLLDKQAKILSEFIYHKLRRHDDEDRELYRQYRQSYSVIISDTNRSFAWFWVPPQQHMIGRRNNPTYEWLTVHRLYMPQKAARQDIYSKTPQWLSQCFSNFHGRYWQCRQHSAAKSCRKTCARAVDESIGRRHGGRVVLPSLLSLLVTVDTTRLLDPQKITRLKGHR